MVDGDGAVGAVLEDDLVVVLRRGALLLGFERKVNVHALLRERQGGHEDDQEDEEDVNQRGDVHVRTGVRHFPLDDLFRAVVLVRVLHYWPPPDPPGLFLRSVIRAMFSIWALRRASMASMMAPYWASLSPLR